MNIALLPTNLDFAENPQPKDRAIDGKSLKGILTLHENTPHEVLYLFNNDRIAGVRKGKWKLVVESFYRSGLPSFDNTDSYYGPNGLLFDLEKDPTETYSYTRENLEVARELHELLEKGQADLKSHVLPNMWNRP